MRVRLNRWFPGDPPSLIIEAETADDRAILGAITDQHGRKIMISGSTWSCDRSGCTNMSIGWEAKSCEPTAKVST